MHRCCWFACIAMLGFASISRAGVVVVGNYTTGEVAFTIAEPGQKARTHTVPAHHVVPIPVTGPADLTVRGYKMAVHVDPYHAYVFIPDRMGVRVELLEMPGNAPERDARAELNPIARTPVKIPVTLYVDDADPRTDELWQTEVRKRFEAAASVLDAQTGFRLEFAGFATWKSEPKEKHIEPQLIAFEAAVKVKPGTLAVGFTSRKLDDASPLGMCRGMGASHVLVREWRPKGEPERVEVLVRNLATALGAVSSPDPGSVMRPKLGDGLALDARFVIRLDPLNALALNLWADQRRLGITDPATIALHDRARLLRVYAALRDAFPDDPLAGDYLALLDKENARAPEPRNPDPAAKKDVPRESGERLKRIEAIREVVRAVTERAKENNAPGERSLQGDALTAELLRVALTAAWKANEVDRVPAFLVGIGIALDDGTTLRDNSLTAAAVKDVETDAERVDRLKVLGNPTLHNRRDLCRRFAVGCATGELLTPTAAENAAISREMLQLQKPAGFSFGCLCAEFAGLALAQRAQREPETLWRLERFAAADLLPDVAGLRGGLGLEKFEAEFSSPQDDRFRGIVTEIRKRIAGLKVNKDSP